jgi:hypothetical protein
MSLPTNTYSVQRRMLIAGLGAIGVLVVVSITYSFMLLKARQDKRAPKNSPEVSKATVAPRRIRHEEERDEVRPSRKLYYPRAFFWHLISTV